MFGGENCVKICDRYEQQYMSNSYCLCEGSSNLEIAEPPWGKGQLINGNVGPLVDYGGLGPEGGFSKCTRPDPVTL